ncbi:MAG TPA: tripartite tricarboxylate transporter permease [Burkholderiales bacterium]|jgi:TctA family transporter|nr:tripartite tricarboxylate transporter permease [Burkholderiales bacterium]
MDLFHNLIYGFSVALHWQNLWYCFVGCFLGTMIGVLPGIGPVATIAMLLPITFNLPPTPALIMLAGIYYGASYGGSTTAILVNLPGESSSVVTCIDGYQMGRQGRAGPALAIAAIGSFFAGCVGTVLIALFGPPLAELAFEFGAAEYFSMMVLGLISAVVLASGSLIKAIGMILIGLLLGIVGTDVNSGIARYSFGISELSDGIGFVSVAMGMFGFGEIISNLEQAAIDRTVNVSVVKSLMPTGNDIKMSIGPILRGTAIGVVFGILPGAHTVIASFSSYTLEKKLAKDPKRFGKGAIEGVAGPESANNAAAQTAFIPLLTLGIPTGAVMALMVGAMTIQGIAPGPQVMTQKPDLFWGMIASMWIGNLMLVILNLPLVGMWVKFLKIPYRLMFPGICLFIAVGAYSINNSSFDVYLAALFGFFGYYTSKWGCEPAPLILGFVLGPLMEENLRRAMLISRGDPSVFFTRPISLGMLLVAFALLLMVVAPQIRKKRAEVITESGD